VIPRHWRTAAGRGYAAREVGTARARIRRRQLAAIILVACAITPVFNVLTSEASLGSAIQGLIDAVLISLLVGGYLMFVRDGWLRSWFRRLGFWADLALSSAIVLALFLVGRAAGQVVKNLEPGRFLTSFTDAHLVYALPFFVVLAVTIQFVLQMNRLIGASVLGYFVAGPACLKDDRLSLDVAEIPQALAERIEVRTVRTRRPGDENSNPGRLSRPLCFRRERRGQGGEDQGDETDAPKKRLGHPQTSNRLPHAADAQQHGLDRTARPVRRTPVLSRRRSRSAAALSWAVAMTVHCFHRPIIQ
jgi:hypothetical protein